MRYLVHDLYGELVADTYDEQEYRAAVWEVRRQVLASDRAWAAWMHPDPPPLHPRGQGRLFRLPRSSPPSTSLSLHRMAYEEPS